MDESFDSEPLSQRYKIISSGKNIKPLKKSAMVVLHILPTCKSNLDLQGIARDNRRFLRPLIVDNINLDLLSSDNVLVYFRNDTCYLEMLPDGKIETAYSNTGIFIDNVIIDYHLERAVYCSIKNNLNFYSTQVNDHVSCPVRIKLALLNVKGFKLKNSSANKEVSTNEDIILETEIINDFDENTINTAIHNICNRIWNSFGEPRSIHFDDQHRFLEN